MTQLTMFDRVTLASERTEMLGEPGVPETVAGTVLRDFGAELMVQFDGPWALGSVSGCRLLVPRYRLVAA